jgi:Fe2+ or Zn2+ uptake regulation protein
MCGEHPPDVAFSLVCERCDAGSEIETFEDALNEGWSDIGYEPDCPMANFIGLCPDCRQREEA